MRGLRDAEWGTELGRLYLEGTITSAMYAAGRRWTEMAEKYRHSIGVFPVKSLSAEKGIRSSRLILIHPKVESEQSATGMQRNGFWRFTAFSHRRECL